MIRRDSFEKMIISQVGRLTKLLYLLPKTGKFVLKRHYPQLIKQQSEKKRICICFGGKRSCYNFYFRFN